MFKEILLIIIGFLFLIYGADFFVDGAKNVAYHLRIPKIIIGLTIVAFGTSAPELAVSIKAFLSSNQDIILGNVIGSNIINILLILGICSLIHPLAINNCSIKKDLKITLFLTFLFSFLIYKKELTRFDGIMLFFIFLMFFYFIIFKHNNVEKNDNEKIIPLIKSIVLTIGGLIFIILGSNMIIDNSSLIAKFQGISTKIISLTIIAFGTSLPELITSLMASIKGEYDIAIGNIIGSNMFNIGVVVGLPVTIFGNINVMNYSLIDILIMLLSITLLSFFLKNKKKISLLNGIIFLLIFLVYYFLIMIYK